MPVPNSMADLAQLAGSNFPTGTESVGNNLDNYLRSHAAIIRSTNAVASASIASASTTDIGAADGERVLVTGNVTITSLGTGFVGCRREVQFSGTPILTHSANIYLPGLANIQVVANDVLSFRCTASGQWALTGASRPAAAIGYAPVNKAGDTMSGALVNNVGLTASTGDANKNVTFASVDSGGINYGQFSHTDGYGVGAFRWTFAGVQNASLSRTGLFSLSPGDTNKAFSVAPQDDTGISYCEFNHADGYSNGGYRWRFNGTTRMTLTRAGALSISAGITPGGGRSINKVTLSNSAPGALADGELFLRY